MFTYTATFDDQTLSGNSPTFQDARRMLAQCIAILRAKFPSANYANGLDSLILFADLASPDSPDRDPYAFVLEKAATLAKQHKARVFFYRSNGGGFNFRLHAHNPECGDLLHVIDGASLA